MADLKLADREVRDALQLRAVPDEGQLGHDLLKALRKDVGDDLVNEIEAGFEGDHPLSNTLALFSAQPSTVAGDVVTVPRECTDEIAEAIAMEVGCCGGIAEAVWRKAIAAAPGSKAECSLALDGRRFHVAVTIAPARTEGEGCHDAS